MKSIHASMQSIVVDAAFDAETDRRLEQPLWLVVTAFGAAVVMTILLGGSLWVVSLLSVVIGSVLGEIASSRRRRRRALVRAGRFKKHLGTPIAEVTR